MSEGIDLTYEGIATLKNPVAISRRKFEGIDLTYEGIATAMQIVRSGLGIDIEGIDLTYEGIATVADQRRCICVRSEGIDLTYEGIATGHILDIHFFSSKELT